MEPELRLFIRERCIINPAPEETAAVRGAKTVAAGLAAIFVPKLIEMGLGSIARLLKNAGADKTAQASGSAFTDIFIAGDTQALHINREIGCLLAIYGTFDDGGDYDEPPDHAIRPSCETRATSPESRTLK